MRLAVAVLFLSILLPAQVSEHPLPKDGKASAKAKSGTSKAPNPSPPPPAIQPSTEANKLQPDTATKQNEHQGESDKRVYRVDVVSQPRDPWYAAYVIASFLGVATTIGALYFVACQTKATRQAAKATLVSAKATEHIARIQEAQFRQWANIGNWRGGGILFNGDIERRWLQFFFDVINETQNPFTFRQVTITIGESTSVIGSSILIPPRGKRKTEGMVTLTEAQLRDFLNDKTLVFHIKGEIMFDDFMGKTQNQTFQAMLIFQQGADVRANYDWV